MIGMVHIRIVKYTTQLGQYMVYIVNFVEVVVDLEVLLIPIIYVHRIDMATYIRVHAVLQQVFGRLCENNDRGYWFTYYFDSLRFEPRIFSHKFPQ